MFLCPELRWICDAIHPLRVLWLPESVSGRSSAKKGGKTSNPMEDYDRFVLNRFSQLRKKEVDRKTASSAIRFYGTPILPPMLTEERRREMQQHRKAAHEAAGNPKLKDNQKMAYVRTVLHSVQLRNSPTLEDLLEGLKADAKSLRCANSSDRSRQSLDTAVEKTWPTPGSSTTNGALVPSRVKPQQSNRETQPASQASSDWSASSGYVTHENMKNATGVSESLDLVSVSSVGTTNTNDFFLHNSSNTIARMSDIISYPPIDGEELERSGQQSPLCRDFIGRIDSSRSMIVEDSVNFPGESPHKFPYTSSLNKDGGEKSEKVIVPWRSCSSSDIPKSSQSRPIVCCPSTEQLIDCDPGKTESADKQIRQAQSQPPHRPSLQDLLKKSQEYRRQQRMLRNQARNARIQERAQEQPRVEEQNLSDKENEEFRCKSTEGRKPKERRCLFNKTVNATTCKKPSEKLPQEELIGKRVPFPQQQPLSLETCQRQDVYPTTNTPVTCIEAQGNQRSIPVPNCSQSPVCNQASGQDREENFRRKALVCSRHRAEEEEEGNLGQQRPVPSSQHIKQLESCLFSLKEVISDLGSSILDIEGKWEDEDNVGEQVQRHQLVSSRQSCDSCASMLEKSDEQKISRVDFSSVLQENGKQAVDLSELSLVNTFTIEGGSDEIGFRKSSGQTLPATSRHSVDQRMQIPDVFTSTLSDPTLWENVSVLSYPISHPAGRKEDVTEEGDSSAHLLSLSQSYDVNAPSGMRGLEGSRFDRDSSDDLARAKQLNPDGTSSNQMLIHENLDRSSALTASEDISEGKPSSSTPTAATPRSHEEELRQVHAAQVRALQEEHRRQQQELLQALAARYQSSPVPCSHLGGIVTFSKLCQPGRAHLEHWRPLLLAAVKGHLTRRLLRTERVAQLARTIGDTQQFLQAFQQQSPKGDVCSKEDRLLQQRVSLQLRVARYEVYNIFFCLSVTERMQLIGLDRDLARERVRRRQMGHTQCPKGRSSLSAATQKSLQRKRGLLIQRKVSERHKTGFTGVQPLESKPGQLRPKLPRISLSSNSCRPR